MSDIEAIQQLINRYTDGVARQDWDEILTTFTPGGLWIAGGVRLDKPEDIRAAMAGFVARFAYFVQINSPAAITVNGDRATARSVIRECGTYADREEALEVLGQYADELVRTPQGWRFASRTFHSLGMHTFALTSVGRL